MPSHLYDFMIVYDSLSMIYDSLSMIYSLKADDCLCFIYNLTY